MVGVLQPNRTDFFASFIHKAGINHFKYLSVAIPAARSCKNNLMTQRHPVQQNATMFVTTNCMDRRPIFHDPAFAREAVECLYRVKKLHPFYLYGFVIMPDHCHFLMNVPAPETMANVIGTFKSGLTFDTGVPRMWQGRYHCRIIESNAVRVLTYIHNNPVVGGLVKNPQDYPWSSASGMWEIDPLGYE